MSTMIASQSYNPETQELTVTFQSGHTYKYYSVPQDVANGFDNATSMGSYFLQNIKHLPFIKEE